LRRLVALAEFSQILSLLLECEVPLPEALQLVGQGSRDSELAFASKALAGDIEHGGSLATSAVHRPGLPHGLRQILRWSERPQTFPDLLRAASEMFESRARMQSSALVPIFEPLVIVFLGLGVGSIVIALYMPLVKLLNDLS
jgi:type II secretory pathway component PulF